LLDRASQREYSSTASYLSRRQVASPLETTVITDCVLLIALDMLATYGMGSPGNPIFRFERG